VRVGKFKRFKRFKRFQRFQRFEVGHCECGAGCWILDAGY
jgi:hypothetical protein